MTLSELLQDEARRRDLFPVTAERVFMAHAGVAPLPRVAVDAVKSFVEQGSMNAQETPEIWLGVARARRNAAQLLGCDASEISLLGPTTLGLNLVANGLTWEEGDEVVYYADDYPANVYPWMNLARLGVRPVALRTEHPGVITWDALEPLITERTRLVALASCNYLSGCRIDINTIGRKLKERDVLFCLDAIQTVGAFDTPVKYVDFLSADAHKWMLGPVSAGIFYVKASRREILRPTLVGSWNVVSPDFVAQSSMSFEEGGRRYEPGTLNLPGILGMSASMEMLLELGLPAISERILDLRSQLLEGVSQHGFVPIMDQHVCEGAMHSGILTLKHPHRDMALLEKQLAEKGVRVSARKDRAGACYLRISPHFYNSEAEVARLMECMA